jgi:hypothetical protein
MFILSLIIGKSSYNRYFTCNGNYTTLAMLFFASWTLQTVTAGNGISQIGVGTVSKETNIGFRFHFSTSLTLKKAPADKARPQPTIQKAISTQWPMA